MKLFKGFDENLECRGFQYKIGGEYRAEKADLCSAGFHACENPLDIFSYYHPKDRCRFCEVDLEDVSEERDSSDTKRCGKVIKIGAELDIAGICKAHFEYVTAKCDPAKTNAAGDKEAASAGERGSASAGFWGSASAGSLGSASAGYKGSASAGERGSASAGERGSASAGESGSASAGYKGSASAGYKGSASAGENGIACCRGGKVRGGLNCVICCAEVNAHGENVGVAAAIVDGVKIKADTWYVVVAGAFVELEDQACVG